MRVIEHSVTSPHDNAGGSSSGPSWFDRNERVGLFFSGPRRDQPLLRELTGSLRPPFVPWNETHLLIGDQVAERLKRVIDEADYAVPLLSHEALSSRWCRFELDQGLAREQVEGRVVLLPLVLESSALAEAPVPLRERRFLECENLSRQGVAQLGSQLMEEIWQLILLGNADTVPRCELERLVQPLDANLRLRLVAMAEMWGRSPERTDWVEVSLVRVRLRLANGRILSRELGWMDQDFDRLRFEYRFGDRRFLVRNEILEEITKQDIQSRLLGGGELLDVTPLR